MDKSQTDFSKVEKFLKRNFYTLFGFLVLFSIISMIFVWNNIENIVKNPCQLCEDTGRKCFEPGEQNTEPLWDRIEYPEHLKDDFNKKS